MRKRMVSAALALCLALTLFSGTALAAGQHPSVSYTHLDVYKRQELPPRPAHRQGPHVVPGQQPGCQGGALRGINGHHMGVHNVTHLQKTTSFPFPIVWAESQADIHGKDVPGEADRELSLIHI